MVLESSLGVLKLLVLPSDQIVQSSLGLELLEFYTAYMRQSTVCDGF